VPWARFDDAFYDHPKLDRLGRYRLPAIGLHLCAVTWSCRHLTDGLIPDARVAALGGTPQLTEALVRAGMWDRLEEYGAYLIHDFDHYNKTREQVMHDRAKWRERQGRSRGESRESHGESHGVTPAVTHSSVRDESRSPVPVPVPGTREIDKERDTGGARGRDPTHIAELLREVTP
jgi:hypothetical protein